MPPTAPTVTKQQESVFSTQETILLDAIFDALRYSNRVLAPTLAEKIESTPVRVREIISELRMKGVLIASDGRGFFIPRTGLEAERTARHLWSRVRAIAKVARAFDKAREQRWGDGFSRNEQIDLVFAEDE